VLAAQQGLASEQLAKQLIQAQEETIRQQKAAVDSQLEAEKEARILLQKTQEL